MSNREYAAEFKHTIEVFIGLGTPAQLLCHENGIDTHRKLKARWKNIQNLEYLDPTDGTTRVKLTDDQILELGAVQPFMHFLQNHLGVRKDFPLDVTKYGQADFTRYFNEDFDEDNPDYEYDSRIAKESEKERLEKDRAAEEHEMKMDLLLQAQLAAATANTMSGAGSSNTNASTSNTPNNPSTGGGTSGNQPDPYHQRKQALDKYMAKFDPSQYKALKDDADYSAWIVHFRMQVKLHGMEDTFST